MIRKRRAKADPPDLIGIDTGGTFTDILALSDGRLTAAKLPTTPREPARAIAEFLAVRSDLAGRAGRVVHGTTVATNALLERRGARTAFVTTRGFADVIEIARQDRPNLYDLYFSLPPPLVPPELRYEITERIGAGGEIVAPLDGDELALLAERFSYANVEAVAVGLLFSPENPAHERAIVGALESLGIPVVASAEILPELREYERFSTAVISAYVAPVLNGYLEGLARSLAPKRLFVMDSAGGALPWKRLAGQAVRAILSGPAAGVTAAAALAARHRCDAVSFDMGGTSTDVALIAGGEVPRTRASRVGGLPIAIPVAGVHTVGAGGGSLAWVDTGGALRVGPRSAGAEPGPIAYASGGDTLTVTDAHVFLGMLPADTLLGGSRALGNFEGIANAMEELARRLALTPVEAARGIVRVVEAEMERALRRVTQERGVDPRRLTLISFGGAGGLHAVSLARALRIERVLVPPAPGLFCALGALLAPIEETAALPIHARIDGKLRTRLERDARALEEKHRVRVLAEAGDECSEDDVVIERRLALRYEGQSHEIDVLWRSGEDPLRAFADAYEERYGEALEGRAVEATALRSRLLLPPRAGLPAMADDNIYGGAGRARSSKAPVFLDGATKAKLVPRLARAALARSETLRGPAIIEELSGTLWLPAGAVSRVQRDGSLEIAVNSRARS